MEMLNEKNSCLLFFVKYPRRGLVKKRLINDLGEEFATNLYEKFVYDMLSKIEKLNIKFKICFYPVDSEAKFIEWLGEKYEYLPQIGNDLGERMKNSFFNTFKEGFEKVALIGSDIPDMPGDFIEKAFLFLDKYDTVIGPSQDGGYYLIGFRKNSFLSDVFNGIQWGKDTVYEFTMDIFRRSEYKVGLLPIWYDIDTISDLKDLFMRNQNNEFFNSNTMTFLMKYKDTFK